MLGWSTNILQLICHMLVFQGCQWILCSVIWWARQWVSPRPGATHQSLGKETHLFTIISCTLNIWIIFFWCMTLECFQLSTCIKITLGLRGHFCLYFLLFVPHKEKIIAILQRVSNSLSENLNQILIPL